MPLPADAAEAVITEAEEAVRLVAATEEARQRRRSRQAEQLAGERGTSSGHRLYVEPDGSFSMVAIVWQPGAVTRIHDHVTWCVFGVLADVEYEDLYTLSEDGTALIEAGNNPNPTGAVSSFAPPGDIHRVRNVSDDIAISLRIYGTDLGRIGTSARRFCDLPVRPAGPLKWQEI